MILQGLTQQLKADELLKEGCFGVQVPDDEAEIRRNVLGPAMGYSGRCRERRPDGPTAKRFACEGGSCRRAPLLSHQGRLGESADGQGQVRDGMRSDLSTMG